MSVAARGTLRPCRPASSGCGQTWSTPARLCPPRLSRGSAELHCHPPSAWALWAPPPLLAPRGRVRRRRRSRRGWPVGACSRCWPARACACRRWGRVRRGRCCSRRPRRRGWTRGTSDCAAACPSCGGRCCQRGCWQPPTSAARPAAIEERRVAYPPRRERPAAGRMASPLLQAAVTAPLAVAVAVAVATAAARRPLLPAAVAGARLAHPPLQWAPLASCLACQVQSPLPNASLLSRRSRQQHRGLAHSRRLVGRHPGPRQPARPGPAPVSARPPLRSAVLLPLLE
mmetsp:Transcript_9932/g.36328  ORF Transcript_9932/g.36328 Transcript_9932/m.36328 type:complete len:286 (-) Transcript_9932:6060-6917(-)